MATGSTYQESLGQALDEVTGSRQTLGEAEIDTTHQAQTDGPAEGSSNSTSTRPPWLAGLAYTGMKVNADGRLTNFAGFPSSQIAPPPSTAKRLRRTSEDERWVKKHLEAAAAEGVPLMTLSGHLASLRPERTATGWCHIAQEIQKASSRQQEFRSSISGLAPRQSTPRSPRQGSPDNESRYSTVDDMAEQGYGKEFDDEEEEEEEEGEEKVEEEGEEEEDARGAEQEQGMSKEPETTVVRTSLQGRKSPINSPDGEGLSYFSGIGRDNFHAFLYAILAKWGVDKDHSGTCLLVNEPWKFAEPRNTLRSLSLGKEFPVPNPSIVSDRDTIHRMIYRDPKSKKSKTAARLIAWYAKWPRTPEEFAAFMSSTNKIDGSHLCHQRFCIIPNHVIWEPALLNLERRNCAQYARGTRANGQDLMAYCTVRGHEPPCLLHFAALTPLEAINIQLSIASKMYGVSFTPTAPPDSKDHPHPTFEVQFPLSPRFQSTLKGCTITLDAANLLDLAQAEMVLRQQDKTVLSCARCLRPWKDIVRLLEHIPSKHHSDLSQGEIAEHMKQAAKEYLMFRKSDVGLPPLPKATSELLNQITHPGFGEDLIYKLGLRIVRISPALLTVDST